LPLLKDLKTQVEELKDELEDESHQRTTFKIMATIRLKIKHKTAFSRRNGSEKWHVHIVLLICDLLTNGIPPSTISVNEQLIAAVFNGCEADEPTSVLYETVPYCTSESQ